MRSNEPTVRASVLSSLPAYPKVRPVNLGELLAEAEVPAQALTEKQLQIPISSAARLFDLVARHLGEPDFGLSYAKLFPKGGTGLLGQIVLSAPTVRDVLKALRPNLQVHMSHIDVEYSEADGIGRFEFAWPATLSEPQIQITSFYIGSLVLRLREATGPTWLPLAVEFQHREPEAIAAYREFFGTRLTFERKSNAIILDATSLSRRMPVIYEGLHESLLELSEIKRREESMATTIAARVQDILSKRLASELAFDLETIASDVELLPRALQWRLEQEQTSYEKVLLATRLNEAERYLRDSTMQLTRIAALLGFSELSAFTRWSQKNFQMTPSAMRQHVRGGGRPPGSSGNDAP